MERRFYVARIKKGWSRWPEQREPGWSRTFEEAAEIIVPYHTDQGYYVVEEVCYEGPAWFRVAEYHPREGRQGAVAWDERSMFVEARRGRRNAA